MAKLIAEMTKYDPEKEVITNEDKRKVVLDGGWLLQKILWKKEESHLRIYEHYYQYACQTNMEKTPPLLSLTDIMDRPLKLCHI
jgi:hypothetical protein